MAGVSKPWPNLPLHNETPPFQGANLISQKIGERVIIEKNDSSILVLEFYVELNSAKKNFCQ